MSTVSEIVLKTRAEWKADGYSVPGDVAPAKVESYLVPGYKRVYRDRHLFSSEQVRKTDPRRVAAAAQAVETCIANMVDAMSTVELSIVSGQTNRQVYDLALSTHGGNYLGEVGEFYWSNRVARNAIRHSLTNYEQQWSRINRGDTGSAAYNILRSRVDELVDETYPQFREGEPEVSVW